MKTPAMTIRIYAALILYLTTTSLVFAAQSATSLAEPQNFTKFAKDYAPLPPLADGAEWYEMRDGLRNSLIKFTREKKGRIAFLGGSITQNPGWQWMVAGYLRTRFPETEFDFINAGIGSTGSTPGAFRLENDVLSKGTIDLLFEEAAVNDLHNSRKPIEQLRAMEGIVRHARETNPKMDIVLLHFADPHHIADYDKGKTPDIIANHEKIATHYNTPSINLAKEVHNRIKAGQFDWKKDFVNLHPSPFGQRLYFWSIQRLFEKAWNTIPGKNEKATSHLLPKQLDPQCYSKGKFVSLQSATALTGFKIDPKCRPKSGGGFRDGFVDVPMLMGEEAGASFELKFSGRGVGLFVAAGPSSGIIEYTIDNGPKRELDTFTPWSRGLNIPWAYILDADLKPGNHTLRLTMSTRKNTNSKGHAIYIRNILVNE